MSKTIAVKSKTVAEHIINDCAPEYLDCMSDVLITAAVKFIGDSPTENLAVCGDEGFKAVVDKVYKDSSIAHVASLSVNDVVTTFYAEHKDDILEYCAESAYRYGESSALELVANFMRLDNENLSFDQIAIALFVPSTGEACEATVTAQRYAIACVLDEVAKAHQLTAYTAAEEAQA